MLKYCDVKLNNSFPNLDRRSPFDFEKGDDDSYVVINCGPVGVENAMMKRALDLTVAVVMLILFAPLMVLIALLIKLDSDGPVFFRQNRVGRGNCTFTIFKFRTMAEKMHCSQVEGFPGRRDHRMTRLGALLRRTSLDELPQIFNVMAGDMSIVGPRPHALESTAENAFFWEIRSDYWDRHVVRPGITGLAQIRGMRGITLTKHDLTRRLQADLEYLTNWSVAQDIGIMMSTARVMMHKNAF